MKTCQKLWEIVSSKGMPQGGFISFLILAISGDIYLDNYTGYYLVREERYVTDAEAKEWDYKYDGWGSTL